MVALGVGRRASARSTALRGTRRAPGASLPTLVAVVEALKDFSKSDAGPVIITAIVGVVGLIVGALLNARHQRRQHLREKMLDAADDFSTALGDAWSAVDAFLLDLTAGDLQGAERDGYRHIFPVARQLEVEARHRLSRVTLLFHPRLPAAAAASEALHFIQEGSHALGRLADGWSEDDWLWVVHEDYGRAAERHDAFNRRARREITRPPGPLRVGL